ncbi:hypothetical protein L6452_43854 [Arctium lappa]|uniref:Uncharacterized protein n=1 Tax=Arctium lappa TaxID=4217 RepID=A0ACB8XI21_ARCLA|nr:hypothetical protein L6452_43854 [Arctium lappa]
MEPTLPVLSRLDRLDRLLELLEEKHGKSRRYESTTTHEEEDGNNHKETLANRPNCKTLLSALDDVHHKGTLIDRLTTLEDRVLQLSLDIEDISTSRSSSSTAYATKEEKEPPIDQCDTKSSGKGRRRRVHFKWMGWMSMGC